MNHPQRFGRFVALGLAALLSLPAGARDRLPQPVAHPASEERLIEVLGEIQGQRYDSALEKVTALTRENPKFRLAQLVQADLLLAMAEPLRGLGTLYGGSDNEMLEGLKEEARVRWSRHTTPPSGDLLPAELIKLNSKQRHVVVVDLSTSRLYLFENRDGEPRLIGDYYVSQGKNGADKHKEGDKRTPIGVYRITSHIPADKLPDLYGDGAYPVDYPNEWDQRLGKTGHGIWLHGNPHDTYSRPPRASDGCVTLPNLELKEVERYFDAGRTPVIFADRIDWRPAQWVVRERKALMATVEQWRKDWESRDSSRYLSHYSRAFRSDSKDYQAWAEHKRRVNSGKSFIAVKLDEVSILGYPGAEREMVVVDYVQEYRSSNYSGTVSKRQYWQREKDGVWRIVYEG